MRRRKWQPTPVLLPGESHRQRSVVGYNPWDGKELDMTEQLHSLRTKFKIKLIKKKKGYFEVMDGLLKFFTFTFVNPRNLVLTLLTWFFYLPTLPSLVS